jgi:ABC-type transport system substrate-binding protein
MTSITRGGFGCHMEIPEVLDIYRKVLKEPDLLKRVELNNQMADFLWQWMPKTGVVDVLTYIIYNPKSVAEWKMRPAFMGSIGMNSFELLVPAR